MKTPERKTLPTELGVISCKDGETVLARQFLAAARQASRKRNRAA